jgi:hypothetical protein
MDKFTFTLEKYRGTKSRYTCPNCKTPREFVRYIDENGNYLSDDIGKCNRESNCGYHKKPKEFFSNNPNLSRSRQFQHKTHIKSEKILTVKLPEIPFDKIDIETFKRTLLTKEENVFVQFLRELFQYDLEALQRVLEKYLVGTWNYELTVFWQIDMKGRIRTGKIMRYDLLSGKRKTIRSWVENGEIRELKTDWIHTKIKRDFKLKQCFFGEHLLCQEPNKTVAIVESEKTALICATRFPDFLWLAAGAKGYLTSKRLNVLMNRKVILFPDADAYISWKEKADIAHRNGFDIQVSDIMEIHSTEIEKKQGFDLADYLILEIRQRSTTKDTYMAVQNNP